MSLLQLSFGGLVFGGLAPNGPYQLQTLTMDMPDVATADMQRALDQGEFAGVDVLPGRDITIVQSVSYPGAPTGMRPTPAQQIALDQAVRALGGVFGPGGATEQPLWLQMASGVFACMARPRKHNCPLDINRVLAGGTVATTLLHATDPRWYAAPSKSTKVGLPPVPEHTTFNISFPLNFGGGTYDSTVTVYNNGLFEVRPKLIITGPATHPLITNMSLPGMPQLGFNVTMNSGDTLTIDTDSQTVVLLPAGASQGISYRNAEMLGNTWFNCPPGPTVLEFVTFDGFQEATLTVELADGYLSL